MALPQFTNAAHLLKKHIWHFGRYPNRADHLTMWNAISQAFQRVQNRWISRDARVRGPVTFSREGAFVLRVDPNSAITDQGMSLNWDTTFDVDASTATHGATTGDTAPSGAGLKTYVVVAVTHEHIEADQTQNDRFETVAQQEWSGMRTRVYRVTGEVALADDMATNANVTAMLSTILADTAEIAGQPAGWIPLLIAQRRFGEADFADTDIIPYGHVMYPEGGSVAEEVEAIRELLAWNHVGQVLTSNGAVASTPAIVAGTPGQVTLTGGERVALAIPTRGTGGAIRKMGIRRITIPETTIPLAAENTTYIVRLKLDENGDVVVYAGTDDQNWPDTSQTPNPHTTADSSSTTAAFWTTASDVALLQVDTGADDTLPTVTAITNKGQLENFYWLLANAYFSGTNTPLSASTVTATTVNATTVNATNVAATERVTASVGFEGPGTTPAPAPEGVKVTGANKHVQAKGYLLALGKFLLGLDIDESPSGAEEVGAFVHRGDGVTAPVWSVHHMSTDVAVDDTIWLLNVAHDDATANASGVRAQIASVSKGVAGATSWAFRLARNSSTTLWNAFEIGLDGVLYQERKQDTNTVEPFFDVEIDRGVIADLSAVAGAGGKLRGFISGIPLWSLNLLTPSAKKGRVEIELANGFGTLTKYLILATSGAFAPNSVYAMARYQYDDGNSRYTEVGGNLGVTAGNITEGAGSHQYTDGTVIRVGLSPAFPDTNGIIIPFAHTNGGDPLLVSAYWLDASTIYIKILDTDGTETNMVGTPGGSGHNVGFAVLHANAMSII